MKAEAARGQEAADKRMLAQMQKAGGGGGGEGTGGMRYTGTANTTQSSYTNVATITSNT